MFQLWKTCFGQNSINPMDLRKEFCGANPTTEQYAMFRYTPIEDLTAVYAYRADRRLSSIVSMIKQKQWVEFLRTYRTTPEKAHFLLMASYRYGRDEHNRRLTSKEAATAFYFLSIAIEDPEFKIRYLDQEYYHFGLTDEQWAAVPENEKVAIYINKEKLTTFARKIIKGSIFDYQIEITGYLAIRNLRGYFSRGYYELSSASILEKNIYGNSPKKMDINFGFPTRREYLNGIFNGENSYALLTPHSKSPRKIQYIHGVATQNNSAWAARHDGAHLYGRQNNFERCYSSDIFHNQFKKIIFALEDIYEKRPSIDSLLIEKEYAKTHLHKTAKAEDLATRIIDEVLIRYVDTEAMIESLNRLNIQEIEHECRGHLTQACSHITKTGGWASNNGNVLNETHTDIIEKAIEVAANLVIPAIQEVVSSSIRNKSPNP